MKAKFVVPAVPLDGETLNDAETGVFCGGGGCCVDPGTLTVAAGDGASPEELNALT